VSAGLRSHPGRPDRQRRNDPAHDRARPDRKRSPPGRLSPRTVSSVSAGPV